MYTVIKNLVRQVSYECDELDAITVTKDTIADNGLRVTVTIFGDILLIAISNNLRVVYAKATLSEYDESDRIISTVIARWNRDI